MSRLFAIVLLAALAAPAAADGTPRDVIIAASPLARLTDDSLEGRRWDEVRELIQAEKTCEAQIDAAVAAGTRLDQEFQMEQVGPIDKMPHTRALPGEPRYWTNLKLIRAMCSSKLAKVQLLRTFHILDEAYHDLQQLKKFGMSSDYEFRLAAGRQRACVREWKRAREAGNDPGVRLGILIEEDQNPTSSERNEMKLGDGQAKICDPLAVEVEKARQGWKKKVNLSKYAALPGDRKKVFEEQALWLEPVFGEARTPIEAPEEYVAASAWYVVLLDRDDFGGPAWILRSFRFDGDKLAETKETRGDGKEPPDAAFQ